MSFRLIILITLFITSIHSHANSSENKSCFKKLNLFSKTRINESSYYQLRDQVEEQIRLLEKIRTSNSTGFLNFLSLFNGQPTRTHLKGTKGFIGKLVAINKDFTVPFLKFLSPTPLPHDWGRGPTYPIFRKLWKDTNYKLSPKEIEILKYYNAYEYYIRIQDFYREKPHLKGVRKSISTTADAAKYLTTLGAGIYAYEQLSGGLLTIDDFLNDPKYALKDNQVQLIMETVPFPHTAIRIGNKIYSYGQTHLSATPIVQYLKHTQFNEAMRANMQRRGIELKENEEDLSNLSLVDKVSAHLGTFSSFLMDKSGLSDLPKSVQVITINLTKEARDDLKRTLVLKTANRYQNKTFVNDCVTMVFRALEKSTDFKMQNRLWDASPAQSSMVLAMMKAAGSESIGPIYQVAIEDTDKPLEHLARNTYINILESNLFIELFHFNQGQRLILDLMLDEDELEVRDEKTQEFIDNIENEVKRILQSDFQLMIIVDQIRRYPELSDSEKEIAKKEYIESIDFIFNRYIEKAISLVNSKESDLQTIIYNEYKVEYLKELKEELKKQLEE